MLHKALVFNVLIVRSHLASDVKTLFGFVLVSNMFNSSASRTFCENPTLNSGSGAAIDG